MRGHVKNMRRLHRGLLALSFTHSTVIRKQWELELQHQNQPTRTRWPHLGLSYGQWSNIGVGGITINNMTAKAPTQVDPLAAATGKTLVVPCFEYYNSKAAHPTPANQMITYLQARRAAGCKIVFATSMDSFLANSTDRGNYNSYWDSNYATYTDAYAPIHTNSNIGIVGACGASQPSTYFTDTIGHPTAADYTVIAGLMTTAINALP